MIKNYSVGAAEMFEIDRRARLEYGVPSVILMENAGRAVFKEAVRMMKGAGSGRHREVVCVCGKGNNGGDGFVCARHLLNHGFYASVFVAIEPELILGDARLNIEILKKMGAKISVLKNPDGICLFKKSLKNAALVIDAVFGIGLTGSITGLQKSIVDLINHCRQPVLAVDVPSGLDATSGRVLGACIRADRTVTFALPKTGLLTPSGRRQAGKIIVADISIPKVLLSRYRRKG